MIYDPHCMGYLAKFSKSFGGHYLLLWADREWKSNYELDFLLSSRCIVYTFAAKLVLVFSRALILLIAIAYQVDQDVEVG